MLSQVSFQNLLRNTSTPAPATSQPRLPAHVAEGRQVQSRLSHPGRLPSRKRGAPPRLSLDRQDTGEVQGLPELQDGLGPSRQKWGPVFLPRAVWVFIASFIDHTKLSMSKAALL